MTNEVQAFDPAKLMEGVRDRKIFGNVFAHMASRVVYELKNRNY